MAKAHTNALHGRSNICVLPTLQVEQPQQEYHPLLCHLHNILPTTKLKLPSQVAVLTSSKAQAPCDRTAWHLVPKFSLSPHCPDTMGQGLLLHTDASPSLPSCALLMRTSSLPWSCVSLLCSGKHTPAESSHPHGP